MTMISVRKATIAIMTSGLMIVAGCSVSRDDSRASVNVAKDVRPRSSLPQADVAPTDDDYVPVPGRGMMHTSCVHPVPNGATIKQNGDVLVGGAVIAHYDPCPYAPMKRDGGSRVPQPPSPTVADQGVYAEDILAYIDYGNYSSFISFDGTWNVPDAPANDGQTIFYWPGIDNDTYLLQPVLQWGPSKAGGGTYWTITAWYCDPVTCYPVYDPIIVSPGASIEGEAFRYICYPDGSGCLWKVQTRDEAALDNWKILTVELPSNQSFDRAWAGVLEQWHVAQCTDYPPAQWFCLGGSCSRIGPSQVTFNINAIYALDYSDQQVQVFPQWQTQAPGGTPDCNFAPVANSTGGTLQVN